MDARDFLMGSGSAGFSFKQVGDRIIGQIVSAPTVQQQRVFGKDELAFWPSGDPKMQMLVPVKTGFRNYEGIATPDRSKPDDGTRTIYVKGKHFEKAVKNAIIEMGADFLDVGGWIDCTFIGEDMESKAGQKPKLFAVRYMPPAPAVAQAQPVQPAPVQPTYTQPSAQPAQNPWGITAPAPAMPAHHEQGPAPDWAVTAAQPVSPAAPTQAPLSTLDAIRAAKMAASGADTPEF